VGGVLDSGFKNSMGAVREQNQNGACRALLGADAGNVEG
jgi:hypothetical protein